MAARPLRRGDHLLLGRVGLAEEDIGADGVIEEIDILEHHGDVGKKAVAGELAQVVTADGYTAGLRVIKAREEAAYRRLS